MPPQQSKMNKVEVFINKFKTDFGNKTEIEDFFMFGYCYHFALILSELFNGVIYYNPVENHFATLCFDDNNEQGLYDISGKLEMSDEWELWSYYSKLDPFEFERIKKNCMYKIYEEE